MLLTISPAKEARKSPSKLRRKFRHQFRQKLRQLPLRENQLVLIMRCKNRQPIFGKRQFPKSRDCCRKLETGCGLKFVGCVWGSLLWKLLGLIVLGKLLETYLYFLEFRLHATYMLLGARRTGKSHNLNRWRTLGPTLPGDLVPRNATERRVFWAQKSTVPAFSDLFRISIAP